MNLDELTKAAKRWKEHRSTTRTRTRSSCYYANGFKEAQYSHDLNALADYAAEVLTAMAEVFGEGTNESS